MIRDRIWTIRSDVYSFGVVVYEVYTFGSFPFDAIEDDSEFLQMLTASAGVGAPERLAAALALPRAAGAELSTLSRQCICSDPHGRPLVGKLIETTRPTWPGADE